MAALVQLWELMSGKWKLAVVNLTSGPPVLALP